MYFRAGGRWAPITWGQFGQAARRITAYLVDEGVAEHDHVAVWSGNRPEWHIADVAILAGRMRPVPLYLTVSAEQAGYILGHSGARVAVVEACEQLDRLLRERDRLPSLQRVVVIEGLDGSSDDGFVIPWALAMQRGEAALGLCAAEVDRRARAVGLDDVATLVYTSGTTGPPKAVVLTHRNITSAISSLSQIAAAEADDRILSYLPLAHIAERMASEFRQYVFGNATWFSSGPQNLASELGEVRPTMFFGVPRVWEKMAARIRAGLDEAGGLRGHLGRWAVRTGETVARARGIGREPGPLLRARYRLADRLVLRRVRSALGLDQARYVASGAAPIAADVLRLFAALGLEVLEIYGQTENCGLTSVNRPGHSRIGTVGPPAPDVDVRLDGDGEILVRSGAVFAGYHGDEQATAATLEDGWLRTGDIGSLDADGYLRVIDRKKDLIITSGGKNIAPGGIENALREHRLVEQAVVIGDRRPFVTALLTLDADELMAVAAENNLPADPATLRDSAVVQAALQAHVDAVNRRLSQVESVKRWTVLPRGFAIGEELTPTLKVRRRIVEERYAAEIDALYASG